MECTVLASDTSPLREVIRHEENGLLGNFFDVEGLTCEALKVLEDPLEYRSLGLAAGARVNQQYSLDATFPKLWGLFMRHVSQPQARA